MKIGYKKAIAITALVAFAIHDTVEMSEEIKTNLTHSQPAYETQSRR